jgi:hypothetical protein
MLSSSECRIDPRTIVAFLSLGLTVRLRRGRIAVRIGVGRGEYSWAVSLIMCTGGEYRGVLHDRHFSAT